MSMKSTAKLAVSVLFFALVFVLASNNGDAQGKHPFYLHALMDLRHARAHLEHGDGGHKLPLVEGIPPPSIRTASRRHRATPLKLAYSM